MGVWNRISVFSYRCEERHRWNCLTFFEKVKQFIWFDFLSTKYNLITRRVVGLSGYFTTIQQSCFVSQKNTIFIDFLTLFWKICFCATSNVGIYLAKSACFRRTKTTLMCSIGEGAGNQETWAPKTTSMCDKKTAEWNKINCLTPFFENFHCDLSCFWAVSIGKWF